MRIETLGQICGEAYTSVDIMAQALALRGYEWGGKLLNEIDEASPWDDDEQIEYRIYDERHPIEVYPLIEEVDEWE